MDLEISIGGVHTAKRGSRLYSARLLTHLALCCDIDSGDKMSFSCKHFKAHTDREKLRSFNWMLSALGLACNRKSSLVPAPSLKDLWSSG